MQGLIKLAIWMAPIFLLALMIILSRLDQNNAQIDTDTARFDREFAHQQVDFLDKSDFWKKEEEEASNRLEEAMISRTKADNKVAQQIDILEENLKKIDEKEEE